MEEELAEKETPETSSVEEENLEQELKEKIFPKKLKMKKTWRNKFVSPTGIELTEIYCRRCVQYKNPKEFSRSTDLFLDKNGMMSVCKSCVDEVYKGFLVAEGSIEKAMLKTCRKFNWVYSEYVIDATKKRYDKTANEKSSFPALYLASLFSISSMEKPGTMIPSDLTFKELQASEFTSREEIDKDEISDEIIDFWGDGYEEWEYKLLQRNFLEFKRDYKIDVKTEIFLAKELCYKMLELEKARKSGGTDGILKSIQTMMKDAAWTPAMANMANSGKSLDTWGTKIAIIQKEEPAEWLESEMEKGRFDKYFGDLKYFKDYYVRSLQNFITGSKDYMIEGEDVQMEDDDEIDLSMVVEDRIDAKEEES
jgi:hypothetical protein